MAWCGELSEPALPLMPQFQAPGFRKVETKPFRPLNGHQRPCRTGVLLLLQKQFIGGGRVLQSIEIEMHQLRRPLGVVLRQGKGGTGDRFADPEALR